MLRNFFVFACALTLAGCSQGNSTPKPAADQPPASTSQPATAPAPQPQSTPPGTPAANPPLETPAQQAAPATTAGNAAQPATPTLPSGVTREEPRTPAATPTTTPAATPATPAVEKAAAATPAFREVTIPAGTALGVTLRTSLASDTSHIEDAVHGTLSKALVIGGVTVVPAGSDVSGTVRSVKRSGRVKGRASIGFRFERLNVGAESHTIQTATVSREAAANRKEDVKKGAIGAAAGAIIGGLAGGGKGAVIGAGAGGTGAVVVTRGEEVRLAAGTTVRTTLQKPLKVVVPGR